MISFVTPAHNEQGLIGATLDALALAAETAGVECERIVVDDGSTDRTAEIARARGARVVSIATRKISASRNAGAARARGELLIFIDADTLMPAATLRAILDTVATGTVAGGTDVRFDDQAPRYMVPTLWLVRRTMRMNRWAFGCCMFARTAAFRAAGGFDERALAGEEIDFSRALARQGRFDLLDQQVVTSSRKARLYSPWRQLHQVAWLLLLGRRGRASRRRLFLWYEGRRER